jgi:hypothetical protein
MGATFCRTASLLPAVSATIYFHAFEKDDSASSEAWEKAMGDLGQHPALKPM